MKLKSQQGFSAVEVVLIVVVVAILGFTGWFVWNSQKNTDKTLSDTNKSQSATPKGITSNKAESQAGSTKYLQIKEWGVKIPLSSADSGAYYKVDTSIEQSAANPTNLTVYSTEVDSISGPTGVSCKGEYIGYLLRYRRDDPRWQPAKSVDDGNVSPLFDLRFDAGEYRYALATKKQYGPTCFEATPNGDYVVDQPTAQKFDTVVNAFKEDFKKIQID